MPGVFNCKEGKKMSVELLERVETREYLLDTEPTVKDLEERTAVVRKAGVMTPPIEKLGYNISPLVYMEDVRGDAAPGNSFKARGAYYAMTKLVARLGKKFKVATASAGNHAQGVANAAELLGVEADIYMPEGTPEVKIQGVRDLASEDLVTVYTKNPDTNKPFYSFDETQLAAQTAEDTEFLSPFNNPDVIAGQGTLAYEALKQRPDTDRLFVTVGGGGLLAGTLEAVAAMKREGLVKPDLKVVAVMLEGNDSLLETINNNWTLSPATGVNDFAEGGAVETIGDIPAVMIEKYKDHLETEIVTFDDMARALWELDFANQSNGSSLPVDETTSLVTRAGAMVRAQRRNLEGGHGKQNWLTVTTGSNASEAKLQKLRDRYMEMYLEAYKQQETEAVEQESTTKFGHKCLSLSGFIGR